MQDENNEMLDEYGSESIKGGDEILDEDFMDQDMKDDFNFEDYEDDPDKDH